MRKSKFVFQSLSEDFCREILREDVMPRTSIISQRVNEDYKSKVTRSPPPPAVNIENGSIILDTLWLDECLIREYNWSEHPFDLSTSVKDITNEVSIYH